MSENDIAVPGEELCVIEEFVPGAYTYIDERGNVRATVTGVVKRDLKTHDIHVQPIKGRQLPSQGDIIIGKVVAMLNEKVAVIKIYAIQRDNGRLEILKHAYTGLLHVVQASDQPTPNTSIKDVVGIGDIVRARVISVKGPPFLLSMKGQNLGVIYAVCPYCRVELRRRGRVLQCPSCGQIFKRKTPIVD